MNRSTRLHIAMAAAPCDGTACLALALEIAASSRVPGAVHAGMAAWSEAELRSFFNGADPSPANAKLEQTPKARAIVALPPPPPPPAPPPTPTRRYDPAAVSAMGMREGQAWRRDHELRKTHWLCKPCDSAFPRETAFCCPRCGGADHSSSGLDDDGAKPFFARLTGRNVALSLVALDVSHNPLGASGAATLATAIRSLPYLTSLDCSGTSASDAGAAAIAQSLRPDAGDGTPPPLAALAMTGCSIKAPGGAAFTALLQAPGALPHLLELGLGWNNIRGDEAAALAQAALSFRGGQLARFCGLPLASLRRGELPPVPPLSERDRRRRPIVDPREELHLQGCGCGPPGAHALAALLPALAARYRLRAIVLPYQDLGDDGAIAIASAAAAHCPELSFVMLSRNDVGHAATSQLRALLPDLDDMALRINNRGG